MVYNEKVGARINKLNRKLNRNKLLKKDYFYISIYRFYWDMNPNNVRGRYKNLDSFIHAVSPINGIKRYINVKTHNNKFKKLLTPRKYKIKPNDKSFFSSYRIRNYKPKPKYCMNVVNYEEALLLIKVFGLLVKQYKIDNFLNIVEKYKKGKVSKTEYLKDINNDELENNIFIEVLLYFFENIMEYDKRIKRQNKLVLNIQEAFIKEYPEDEPLYMLSRIFRAGRDGIYRPILQILKFVSGTLNKPIKQQIKYAKYDVFMDGKYQQLDKVAVNVFTYDQLKALYDFILTFSKNEERIYLDVESYINGTGGSHFRADSKEMFSTIDILKRFLENPQFFEERWQVTYKENKVYKSFKI